MPTLRLKHTEISVEMDGDPLAAAVRGIIDAVAGTRPIVTAPPELESPRGAVQAALPAPAESTRPTKGRQPKTRPAKAARAAKTPRGKPVRAGNRRGNQNLNLVRDFLAKNFEETVADIRNDISGPGHELKLQTVYGILDRDPELFKKDPVTKRWSLV